MKKTIRRYLSVLLILSLLLVLAGCGGGDNGTGETAQDNQTAEDAAPPASDTEGGEPADGGLPTYKVGFSNVWVGNSWGVQCVNELESFLRNHEQVEEYYITDANNDTNKQISDIEDLLSKDIDLLILQPISPDAVAPIIERAYADGVIVVTCASPVGTDDYHASVLAMDEDFGRVGMEWLAEELGGEGKIIVLNGMAGLTVSVNRYAGAQAVLENYPGIEVLAEADADWDYATGKMATENLLAAYPEIDGVWSQGGEMTRGAIEAFQAAGRDLVPMTGEDSNGFLKAWQENAPDGFAAIATSMPTWLFAEGAQIGIDILNGNAPAERDIVVDIPVITSDTLDSYVRDDLSDAFWANTRMPEADILALYGEDRDGTQGLG